MIPIKDLKMKVEINRSKTFVQCFFFSILPEDVGGFKTI